MCVCVCVYFLWIKQFEKTSVTLKNYFYLKEKNKIPPVDSADYSFIQYTELWELQNKTLLLCYPKY